MYRKPTFTGQYLNFNSHQPIYGKERNSPLQKPLVAILMHIKKKWLVLRDNLHRNNYSERITSAPINLDWRMEENTRKLTTVCLPYVKGLAGRIQKICSPYDIRALFASGSTLRRYLLRVKPPTEFNCVYSIPCSCGKIYKGEKCRPLKVRLEEHRKAVVRGEIEKSGMADHIWKEKGNHLPLWDKIEIIDRAEHWRIRRLRNLNICWATMTCWVDQV